MSTFEKLLPASFRGMPFLVPSSEITEGRKTVSHEFVNSDKRYVEDLGLSPSRYKVTAIVAGDRNNSAEQNKDRLRAVLLQPGVGILIHPIYGRQEVTVENQYTVGYDQKELGSYTFSIDFAVSRTVIQPRVQVNKPIQVAQKDKELRQSVKDNLAIAWIKPQTAVSNQELAGKLTDFAEITNTAFLPVAGDKSALFEHINNSINAATSLVATGTGIADTVYNTFSFIGDIETTDPLTVFEALSTLFDFGLGDIPITNIFGLSTDQNERTFDRELLNTSIATSAVSQAFSVATNSEFLTDVDLNTVRGQLDIATRNVIKRLRGFVNVFDAATNSGIETSPIGVGEIISDLQNLLANANQVFNDKELSTYKVTTLRTVPTSARLVSYNLYEGEDMAETIEALNIVNRPSGIEGDISVLSK